MASYTFSIHVDAPPELVFALWTNLHRMGNGSSWVFSRGSYEGSFRGELEKFGRIAERDARELANFRHELPQP